MRFKFTEKWINAEKDGLIIHYPELNMDDVYEVISWELYDGCEGATKIKNTRTSELFDISELATNESVLKSGISWWCFITKDFDNEYEEYHNAD